MDKLELFDQYIKGMLSDEERAKFEVRLKAEPDFATDFKTYLFTVNGICQDVAQDHLELGTALKKISKEQLREIIGPRKAAQPKSAAMKPKDTGKRVTFIPRVWKSLSVAAVAVIGFTAVFQAQRQSQYKVDQVLYSCYVGENALFRSSTQTMDISSLNDAELKVILPQLREKFEATTNEQDVAEMGYSLALAYLRIHDRDNAREVLMNTIDKLQRYPDDYVKQVEVLQTILRFIE